ncbi:MAG TPA: ATP synthase F1 subunit gamma [Thermoanaerobaculia bacterium]|nr:ATP synthase F1 subunit gamma [Thermoanaerobaculia bacterium]
MPSLIDLRRRIRSVKNIQQITRAMKMVAAARLRRAQDRILAARPYAEALREVVGNLSARVGERGHPLLVEREVTKALLVVVTGDKGLAGAFNTNVIRRARQEIAATAELDLLLIGRRGADFFRRRSSRIRSTHTTIFAKVTFEAAAEIARDISKAFTSREYDAVYIVYNQFVSAMNQKLTFERLLPLEAGGARASPGRPTAAAGAQALDYIFEPSAPEILDRVVPGYVSTQVHRILLDSQAAYYAAQMTAMEAATKNAGDLIDRLKLNYNRSRQAAITKELIEIVSGAKALEG